MRNNDSIHVDDLYENPTYLSTGWVGDWSTLNDAEMLARAEMLETYYDNLPAGILSEARAEAALIRREINKRNGRT